MLTRDDTLAALRQQLSDLENQGYDLEWEIDTAEEELRAIRSQIDDVTEYIDALVANEQWKPTIPRCTETLELF